MGLENWTYNPSNTAVDQLGAFQYTEAKTSGTIKLGSNASLTRIFYIGFDEIAQFTSDLLGGAIIDGTGINRTLPDRHPLYPTLYAIGDCSVEPFGVLGEDELNKTAHYTAARVTAEYRSPTFYIIDDASTSSELQRFVSRTYKVSGDYYTVNPLGMKFVSADPATATVIQQPPGKVTGVMELTYTWHWVPAKPSNPFIPPNLATIVSNLGKVNNAVFDVGSLNAPAGTVLCLGIDPRMTSNKLKEGFADLNHYWEIVCTFLYRNNGTISVPGGGNITAGHQCLFNQGTGAWELITADGTAGGGRLYQESDLNSIFSIT